ncbi:DUF2268 domain-containing protein [Bacillus sp. MRMR6]|uniref:DUF2268 domain-containing protein n=1 Tax=Bacillus sp. MRMR6 TaxID=1928617 RepID=UPI000952971C|nr:DUF2268 domain-containing putative Zn-dependent protease [Bacillus sp. MRMR6]OLS41803.1 hypothetical protein BTR25_00055 [Bacillus sp. MRMR6]
MSVIRTDRWLEEDIDHPVKICEKLEPNFKGHDAVGIYRILTKFGMYKPTKGTRGVYEGLKEKDTWECVEKIYQNYKKKWDGPNIPIYIFPTYQSSGLFSRGERLKGGVSFPDKLFLFLSDKVAPQDVESLFVHEYHHVCRLNMQNKSFEDYTLLDSIIIEGLAEYAVLVNCGRQYLANWCTMYSESDIQYFMEKYLKDNLGKKKMEREHDELLYGGGGIPNMLGYSAGYKIVERYYQTNSYSTKLSFTTPSKKYIVELIEFSRENPD